MTCMGFSIWWRYRAQWGALKQFEGTVHGAHGKPLHIAGKTHHLDIQWGEARGRASFIVIVGLESPPCLIGMDIMRPLRVHIDVTNGTATPAQPDPQTVHLNAAQSQQRRQEKPLPGTGLPFSQATGPPPAPPPQGGKPLPEASSPALRPASPPQILLPREGNSVTESSTLAGETADSSRNQPQRKEMPLPGAGMSAPPPPEVHRPAAASPGEFPPSAPLSTAPPCTATPHTASCARLLQTADIPHRDGSPHPLPQSLACRGRPFLP